MNQPRSNGTTRRTQTAPTRMTHPSAAQSLRKSRVIGTADHQSTYAIKEDFRSEGNSRAPCERCLFKMIRDGGHECKPQPRGPRRRIACLFCAKQKKGCKKIHPAFHDRIFKALRLDGEERKEKLRIIKADIELRHELDELAEDVRQTSRQLQNELEQTMEYAELIPDISYFEVPVVEAEASHQAEVQIKEELEQTLEYSEPTLDVSAFGMPAIETGTLAFGQSHQAPDTSSLPVAYSRMISWMMRSRLLVIFIDGYLTVYHYLPSFNGWGIRNVINKWIFRRV
ncbi:hypothetical protein PENSTE_c023G02812 [Penicillium steckii]|uniref:Uncharacterized protein n=1 Tax=Penicillium steckii TaxID=303698 RepID=A0A1V6SSV3_9EURO|nr:hypothetical protein PENSTE_c023G02812 [Penicillium steckii]